MVLDPAYRFDFSEIFLSMRNSGLILADTFARFGSAFTKPFAEGFLQLTFPSLYLTLEPVFTFYKKTLSTVLGSSIADLIFGFSLFDIVLFGIGVVVFINVLRKVFEAIPLA